MGNTSLQDQIDEATFEFSIGDSSGALSKLKAITNEHPQCSDAWLALGEVLFAEGELENALQSVEKAHEINPDDVHINTSLSRVWVGLGNKEKAEHFGAQARMLGWKVTLQDPPETDKL
ncbi:MAG: tetratricopeptide repeat protein [Coraliomargaritaceae bacterium]